MKRKFLLLVMMCLFGGLSSSLMAQEPVTINGTVGGYASAGSSNYVPFNTKYEYTTSQQIYLKEELVGMKDGDQITSVAIHVKSVNGSCTRKIKIYMANITEDRFNTTTFYPFLMNTTDLVLETSITIDAKNKWYTLELTNPFKYTGNNILFCVHDVTGSKYMYNNNSSNVTFDAYRPNERENGVLVLRQLYKYASASYDPTAAATSTTKFAYPSVTSSTGYNSLNWVQFTYTSGGSSETTAPTAPTLNYPSNNNQEYVFNPFLRFTLGSNTTHYQIQMGTDQDNMTDLTDWVEKTKDEVDYQTSKLTPATTYFWKVVAKNDKNNDPKETSSSVYSFTTKEITTAPGQITGAYPNGHQNLQNPNFTWTFGADTEEYQVIIDGEAKTEWINPGSFTTGSYQTSGLSSGEHTWRIDATNFLGTTTGTEYTFSIASLPDNVTPVSPADSAQNVTSNIIRFNFAEGTVKYRILYDRGYGFEYLNGSDWKQTNNATTGEFTLPEFEVGKKYYWAVDVKNDAGTRAVYKTGNEADAKDVTIYSFTVSSTLPVTNTAPADGAANLDNPTLTWKYNGNATHYQVYFGTDANNLKAKGWMERATEGTGLVPNGSYATTDLEENTTYFWRVDVKDANENVYKGATWSFTSKLPVPQNVTANPDQVIPTYGVKYGETTIMWNSMDGVKGYNVYCGTTKLNSELIGANKNSYKIEANANSKILEYNMDPGYSIYVEAVFAEGTSMSEAVIVKVTGTGFLSAIVTEDINNKGVAGATITLTPLEDEFGNKNNGETYTLTTDSYGEYSSADINYGKRILNGTYSINVTQKDYIYTGSQTVKIENNKITEVTLVISPNIPDDVTPVTPVDEATNVTSKTIKFALAEGTEAYRFLYGETDKQLGEQGMQPMGYYINGETDNKATWVETNGATEAEVEIPYITAGKTHYWAIEVMNAVGQRLFFGATGNVLYKDVAVYSFTANETLPVTNTAPANGATNLTNPTLTWKYNGNATSYMVRLGEREDELYPYPNGDYQARGEEETGSLTTASLKERTKYYWRVDVLDANDKAYKGDVWSFVSTLPAPVATANSTQIVPTLSGTYGETTISWEALEGVTGYNVYLGTEKLNDEILSAETTEYTIAATTLKLTHNMENGYDINVEAVYELGNSMSKAVNVKVTGSGFLNAEIVKDFKPTLGVDGATITLTQTKDEFENTEGLNVSYTFTTDDNGTIETQRVLNGQYAVEVSRNHYETYKGTIEIKQGVTTNLNVTLVADPANVFDVFTNEKENTFNYINVYLDNSNWKTAPAGRYNVYLKNGEEVTVIGSKDFVALAAGVEGITTVYFEYTGWANLSKGSYQFGVANVEDQINWSAAVTRNYDIFDGEDSDWNNPKSWKDGVVPGEGANAHIFKPVTINGDVTVATVTIEDGGQLTINGSLTANEVVNNGEAANALCLNDGGQLRQTGNAELNGVFNMNVTAPTAWDNTTNKDGWQFIASPFTNAKVEAWTTGSYDFYKYDGTQQLEWINEKDDTNKDFEEVFVQGRGYLASHENENITLSGTFNNATTYTWKGLTYNEANDPSDPESKDLANFYLLGNPFTFNMDMSAVKYNSLVEGFAIVNAEGGYTYVGADQETTTIPVGDGFFVKVKEPNATDEISLSYTETRSSREKSANINLVATSKAGKDNVVINFAGQSEGFNKLQNFNDEIATVCVVENGKAYGIYNCESDVNEIEVMFSAKQMGSYSLSFDINGEFETVTLVDRMTGVETDMIEEGEYNFIATSNDMKNRFVVRLSNSMTATEEFLANFVYQSGEELIVNAEGTIQIIDMMGRVVYSAEHSNGSNRINVSEFNNAAYVVRVVNGNGVRSQKVVIY